jgi:HTH-type transcriptional regulator / antitoxin HigA
MIGTNNASYGDLLSAFLPRPIKTEAEYAAIQAEVDRLIDRGDLSPAEQDYLDLLGTLIWEYESHNENKATYELRGVELLKGLMELYSLKQKDLLPIFKTRSIASAVLSGKRQLTTEHINKLAAFFNLSHPLFFELAQVESFYAQT